jgi:hypothetical protein
MLYLEVNIGGGRTPGKLLIFEGDQPEEVVQCFAKVYGISENKRVKLLEIVKVQLTKILQQIGEVIDSEKEDEDSSSSGSDEIIRECDRANSGEFRQYCDQ